MIDHSIYKSTIHYLKKVLAKSLKGIEILLESHLNEWPSDQAAIRKPSKKWYWKWSSNIF